MILLSGMSKLLAASKFDGKAQAPRHNAGAIGASARRIGGNFAAVGETKARRCGIPATDLEDVIVYQCNTLFLRRW
jgi:hypothetical protein